MERRRKKNLARQLYEHREELKKVLKKYGKVKEIPFTAISIGSRTHRSQRRERKLNLIIRAIPSMLPWKPMYLTKTVKQKPRLLIATPAI